MRNLPPFVAALALIPALTGCGGGPSTPPSAAVPPGAAAPADTTPAPEADPMTTSNAPSPASNEPPVELRNRLAGETSPYLLQHQHNPVHWFPWGPEAFEAARRLDRLIFVSVGYSTCYWCHVMERESFEDEATAAVMNEHFVCVKVDREERPDVDDIYMAAVQAQNQGHGGWPMSVFIEPHSLKPFISGTYFPPDGPRAFTGVLEQVAGYWRDRRSDVMQQCDAVAAAVTQQLSMAATPEPIGAREVEKGVSQLLSAYDREHAGFVGNAAKAPKFPTPVTLDYLIGTSWKLGPVRDAVIHTLDRMATGGMYDQVGGGFHRYSVDREWLVPHFEKMLYDNGQLASTYADVYGRTNDPYYAQVVREVLDYVLEHMTADGGAFYSAQDAEVNHREGENYLWTEAQVRAALTDAGLEAEIDFALDVYGFQRGTNFTDPHHPEDGPKNVVFLVERPDAAAERLGLTDDEFAAKRRAVNEALLAVRDGRDQPITDDKILTAWNGLMIKGFADGGRVLNENRYRSAAARAADYILDRMRAADGRGLLRTSREGVAKIDAFCEDYAAMVRGLLAVHRASRESRHLEAAADLMEVARTRFWDESSGGYFDTVADRDDLFVRTKSSYDGALPSANSMMIHNLLDLHEATGEDRYLDDAVAALTALSSVVKRAPTSSELTTLALHRVLEKHPGRLGASAAAAVAPTDFGGKKIRVTTSTRTVHLSPETPATVEVTLELAKGWHANAHVPGVEFLIPLEIVVVGANGVEVDVDYPAGEAYDGPEGRMMVHHGKVTIPVTIRQTGAVSGRPQLMIKYQLCDDQMCLAPETERLPVGLITGGS